MLQPCAIVVEDVVIALAKRAAGKDVGQRYATTIRLIGYGWVAFVFSMTLPEFGMAWMVLLTGKSVETAY
jgi:hypothetical protein